MAGKSLNYYDQANQLPAVKEGRPEYTEIHSQVLQDVLRRVDKAFQAFFRRIKAGAGETPGYPRYPGYPGYPGYPRYKGAGWYDSFTFPQLGWSLQNPERSRTGRLTLSKIGTVKVRLHRAIQGKVKTVSIKREGGYPMGAWYVCFCVEVADVADVALPRSDKAVGIDVGLATFATLSTGSELRTHVACVSRFTNLRLPNRPFPAARVAVTVEPKRSRLLLEYIGASATSVLTSCTSTLAAW